jgi:death-on-curing protein
MILFLTARDIAREQELQVSSYGGGPTGILNEHRLESAANLPQWALAEGDIFDVGASYLVYLIKGHPFHNANKRSGLAATLHFLHINNIEIVAAANELIDLVLFTATMEAAEGKENAAAFLRSHQNNVDLEIAAKRNTLNLSEKLECARTWSHKYYTKVFKRLVDL